MNKRISDIKLERYLLDELSQDEKQQVEEQLQTDELLQRRLEELQKSNEELLQKYSPEEFLQGIRNKQNIKNAQTSEAEKKEVAQGNAIPFPIFKNMSFGSIAAVLLVLMLPAVVVVSNYGGDGTEEDIQYAVRTKGTHNPDLFIYKKSGDSALLLDDSTLVYQGDRLQLKYKAPEEAFGFIFSVDGRGVLTRHLPLQGSMSSVLEPKSLTTLEYAYELDDAPQWEKFFFVSSADAFRLEEVIQNAKIMFQTGDSVLRVNPEKFHVRQIVLPKAKVAKVKKPGVDP